METLIAQANGAGNHKRVGVIMQRAGLITACICIPVLILWFISDLLLISLKQDPYISGLSGIYMRVMSLSLLPVCLSQILQRALQMQGKVRPPIFSNIAAAIVNPILQYIFIFVLELGLVGSAIAFSCAQVTNAAILLAYFVFSKSMRRTWYGWTRESLQGWKEYLKLGLPGAAMICLEWGSFEIVALGVGLLHRSELLAAHIVIVNVVALCWMVPGGIGQATANRVGNWLGSGSAAESKRAALVGMWCGATSVLICASLIFFTRGLWPTLFTNDQQVITEVQRVVPLICLAFVPFDGMQGDLGGIIRGSGQQKWGAVVNLVAFYIVGIPLSLMSTLWWGWELQGTWLGLAAAELCISTGYLIVLLRSNWTKLAQQSKERAKGEFEKIAKDEDIELALVAESDDGPIPSNQIELEPSEQIVLETIQEDQVIDVRQSPDM
eukprot:TRINITY_DN6122_c0_g1_i2.p1 TRINITY_DN6122_c0_g1~~TRINITY_DN6122_c0_g1_i2.p1  ORF type:complete len:439 (+),score=117.77 TRINITY_DN6122_c0_g1_i2:623-1939(+)